MPARVTPSTAASAESARIVSLARPATRTAAPSVRATAIAFEDPASLAIRAELDLLAPSEASVVVVGETGTGKELVARYLHDHSHRSHRPFIAVNCGALVDSLVEAELFGYERGAFTGAVRSQAGWFEAASGGTLLLDEIGDLPPPLQVKLLRVLQEREVVRLGSRTAVPVDVRVLAATNVDLAEAVAAGRFRQDLFFRLNVATVALPPLRRRPADIPFLAGHFLDLYRERLKRPELTFSRAASAALAAHSWPGNIRELENAVHHAVLLSSGPQILPADLKLTRLEALAGDVTLEDQVRALVAARLDAGEPDLFNRLQSVIVRTAFERNDSNQVRTAAALGISRNELRTQLAHLGIIAGRNARRSAEAADD
jgi:DNA-binding NtrC family response regulator